jgi:ankyrin repeat protein
MPALHDAVKKGDLAAVDKLLEDEDADVDELDSAGTTALYHACKSNRMDIVELLIERGAEMDEDWDCGSRKAPLYAAAKEGHTDLVAFLLKHGASPNTMKDDHRHPLYYAKNGAIVRLLLEAGAEWLEDIDLSSVVHSAAWDGRVDALKELVKHPEIDLGYQQPYFGTAARVAVEHGQADALQVLLDAGASPYSKHFDAWEACDSDKPNFGRIVLMLAEISDGYFEPIHGLEKALPEVWEKKPEALPKFFGCLSPAGKAKIQTALRVLTRGKVTESELCKKIILEAFSG